MVGYLFDTMVHVVAYEGIPEKWYRQWKEATVGRKRLLLFEPLVAEILYQLARRKGERTALERILWLKGLQSTTMVELTDNIAFDAGRLYMRFTNKIGMVDSFLLAIAKKNQAEIFTTDHNLRDVGKEIAVRVHYMPKKSLER